MSRVYEVADQATLLTISDMSVLETRVKVDETDVARIKVGDSAQIQIDAFPDTTFLGRVTKISNSSVKAATTSSDQAVDYEVGQLGRAVQASAVPINRQASSR